MYTCLSTFRPVLIYVFALFGGFLNKSTLSVGSSVQRRRLTASQQIRLKLCFLFFLRRIKSQRLLYAFENCQHQGNFSNTYIRAEGERRRSHSVRHTQWIGATATSKVTSIALAIILRVEMRK